MKKILLPVFLGLAHFAVAQGLLDEIDDSTAQPDKVFVRNTFKSPRLINGHTNEIPGKDNMVFIISHRFGDATQKNTFFGLDQATMRIGLEYSPLEWLNVGLGRNTYMKTVDGFVKANVFRQRTGKKPFPVHITYIAAMGVATGPWANPARTNYFSSRLSYTHQVLISRKFNDYVSLQLMPTMVHKNIVPLASDNNDLYALGVGGRVKVSRRIALCAEYYHPLNKYPTIETQKVYAPVALGFDIETGGHVFQLHFTNAGAMFEKGFITETTGDFFKGVIRFGFNITRTFYL